MTSSGSTPRGNRPLWIAAAAALAAAAYGPLVFEIPSLGRRAVEGFFFDPDRPPAAMVIAVAGWLAWRRRGTLAALRPAAHPARALPLFALGLGCAVWSERAAAPDWLVLSLGFHALAFGVAARGAEAARVLALPVAVLLFAIPIPDPLENEIVWMLQRLTARGALWIHVLAGLETSGQDVLLNRGDSAFLVIEECSGLRGLLTLTLVAIVVRDLFAQGGARVGWVIALAPPLAIAINLLRVAWIATGEADAPPESHIGQGAAMLLAGTAVLFFTGHLLARDAQSSPDPKVSRGAWPWRAACAALALQLVLSAWIPEAHGVETAPLDLRDRFADRGGWRGEHVPADFTFRGRVALGASLQRRYLRRASALEPPQVVELFVGVEHPERPRESPFSSKHALPGRDWSMQEISSRRDWRLFRDVEVGIAARGDQRALVQTWNLGSDGLWCDSLRSLLALRSAGLARAQPRVVVRLVTPIVGEGSRARERARAVMDGFLIDYGGELEALEQDGDPGA